MKIRQSQVIRAVELYYERNLSQREVANILGISRTSVSRLLTEAKETGVVKIRINRPLAKLPALSEQLRLAFGQRGVFLRNCLTECRRSS